MMEVEKSVFSSWIMALQVPGKKDTEPKQGSYKAWIRRYLLSEQAFNIMEHQNKATAGNLEELSRYLRLVAAEQMEMALNFQYIDLQKVNFNGLLSSGMNLFGADLRNASLANACFDKVNFENANMSNANLGYSDLWGVT
ncbi:MAG: pentapeptide repeat-containing protein [Saprospiraceae bacterium]|nr:pentapeptide repeat-containing protein [Saprospiraceae bacterium]